MDKLYTVPEISKIMGLSRSTIYKACLERQIGHYRFASGIVRIPEDSLRRYLSMKVKTE